MVESALYVEEHTGQRDAPVVVLVHGVLDSSRSFAGVVEALVPEFTVVSYDRRGWARSIGASPARSLADHAADLVDVACERPCIVVGHSYGATTAMLASVERPDVVKALGLFEPYMPWLDWWPSFETIDAQAPMEQVHLQAGLESFPVPTRDERARDKTLMWEELTFIESAPFGLDEIVAPRLVGRGQRSVPWRVATTDRLRCELSCELVTLGHAGHTAHRVQPRLFADFVRQVSALSDELR